MKKRRIKLDKVFIIAVILILIASLTACDNVQNKIHETTTEPMTTTKATTTKATTTIEAEATETTTTKATTITTTIKATTTTKPTTTKPSTQKVTTTQKEQTTKKAVPTEYDRLLSKLKKELNKKSFDEEVNKLFFEVFEQLYKNYPTWQHGYSDLPNRKRYVETHLIDVIDGIYEINFYERGSDEANRLLDEGLPEGWVELDENNRRKVFIISESYNTQEKERRMEDVESFFHEITHCYQGSTTYYSEYFDDSDLDYILTEGGATFHMKFIQHRNEPATGSWLVADENEEYHIAYTKSNCIGYLLDMNAYEKMVYLVGYETVEKVTTGQSLFSAIQDIVSKKYGEENANRFFKTMNDWYTEYNNAWKSNITYNLALELENQFINFIKQDIESLKTKQEAEKYKSKYDFYMTKNLPVVTDTQSYQDLTREKFDIETLDKMLEEKLK